MIVPDRELRRGTGRRTPGNDGSSPVPRRRTRSALRLLLLLFVAAVLAWFSHLYRQIGHYAHTDEARPADAIAVFGAAEYYGRPSPVLRARLEHALALYQQNLAPYIVTLGGAGDPQHSEGSVGREFLLAHGVPENCIIAETVSGNTEASVERLVSIARANNFGSVLAVSDGTHLFRIHALLAGSGLEVHTSPRPELRPLPAPERMKRIAHEMASYTLWRIGIR